MAVGALSGSVSEASNFGPKYADNGTHAIAFVNLQSYTVTAATHGLNQIDVHTDMQASQVGVCHSTTDVCVYDANYTGEF